MRGLRPLEHLNEVAAGSGCPIVEGDKIIVNVGGDEDNSGIVAFAADTGRIVWRATRERASYSSPVAVSVEGTRHVIFLTADAFGVLPPISRLTPEQAMYHFLSGYTAKLAGTERGVTEPQATFSTCFGAPFLPLHPTVYARMLGEKLAQHKAQVWLVNTGWSGGPYGVGQRMKIAYTRAMVHAALNGELDEVPTELDPIFDDIARVGGRYSDEWHRIHLNNPRDVVPESNMPGYPWLATTRLTGEDTAAKMRAFQTFGVPYTDDDIRKAPYEVQGKTEQEALIAYLQQLGTVMKRGQ